ncbi:predicted protein [Naegleria gruberi]|uniref:Predicted protein n=1 Tax=Naegleria gruberi TaxID=5762 RepID=D2VPG5_NAEGR|nr:uncharacterized protein NAEGRDRAFT_58846 [Naegleria gruberi]EFC41354.1 predicted protein [Naegleria gruberi]|eukprot:XP_002674098.1 predicted protein [Naegleria gruberi strain NEG-M]
MTGVQAAFKEINENSGGVWGGKKLRLITLDDGYEPARTVNNTIQLINNNTIFGLIGYMGTGTSQAAFPYLTESKLPFIGAFTGGLFLRTPFVSNIVNIRASYQDETVAMVEYLVTVKMVRRIAIFYQNDAFGMSGVDGSSLALTALGMSLVSRGSYERNTIVVAKAVSDIVAGNPQAIICMSTYKPTLEFINTVKNRTDFDPNIVFMTGSFIGSNILPYRDSVVITQVLPPPTNTKYPIVLAYQRAMKASNPNFVPSYVELEGYIAGKMAANILTQRVSGDLTRSNFLQLVYSTSTYIIDNQVIGPYKQCSSSRSLHYFFDDPQNQDAFLYPVLQPRTRLIPRKIESTFVAPCSCNQGLRSIWKTSQNADSSFSEISDPMVWDTTSTTNYTCFYDPTKTLPPIVFGHISSGDKYDEDFLVGVLLAFNEKNNQKGIRGSVLRILTKTPSNSSASALIDTVNLLKNDFNVLGILGGFLPSSSYAQFVDQFKTQLPNTLFLSPSTSYDSPTLRSVFSPNIIHIGLSIREKLATFFDFEMNANGHSRFSVVYGKSTEGAADCKEFKNQLSQFGLTVESEYEHSSSVTDYKLVTQALVSNDGNPQSVVVLLPENISSFSYLSTVIKGIVNIGKRDDLSIFFLYFKYTSWVADVFNLMASLNTKNNVYLIQRYPHVVDTQLPLVAAYNNLFSKYYSSSVSTTGSLEGFLAASFLIEVLENISPSADINGPSTIFTIYQTQQFLKYSIPFGNFISNSCNLGMRTTYLYKLDGSTFTNVKIQSFDKTKCGLSEDIFSSESSIEKQLLFGRLLPVEDASLPYDDFSVGLNALFTSYNTKGTLDTATLHLKTLYYSSREEMTKKAEELILKYKIFGFLGSRLVYDVTELKAIMENYKIPIIGPLSSQLALREPYSRFVVNLRPSIVEESVVLTRYLTSVITSRKPTVLILSGSSYYWQQNSNNVVSFYSKSIEGVSISSTSISSVSSTSGRAVEGSKPDLVLLLASPTEVSQFLTNYPTFSSLIGIPSEISSISSFKTLLNDIPSSVIISPQFLERYDKASSTNFMARDFLIDMAKYSTSSNTSTLMYEAYAVGYMTTTVLKFMSQANMDYSREKFVSTFFERSVFELGNNEFGPYGDECSIQSTFVVKGSCESVSVCNCSQGVRALQINSLTSSSDSILYEMNFKTCGLQAIEPLLSDGAIAGVAVGGTLAFLGTLFVILVLIFCARNRSSVKNAPKSGNITCAFTDVQSSTKLWQNNEKAMRNALEIHDKIMRKNLELFRGYEVKTNGDSFFVAFKDPFDAVLWSLTVQLDLLNANWPSELYHEYDCRQEWDERIKKPYWSGLRVRIGLHYGKGDCKWDKTMKRFDYFGTVVNKSARIEALAHGGQVLISEELLEVTKDLFQDVKKIASCDEFPAYQTTTKEEKKLAVDDKTSTTASLKHQNSLSSVLVDYV